MSTTQAALVLHPAALLAGHPHKETMKHSLHKLGAQASAIIHGPNHEALTALIFIVFVAALLYAIKITFLSRG